jgi:hypothetical protein
MPRQNGQESHMTDPRKLTRDEADDIAQVHGMSVNFVDTLVALGCLEVIEPEGDTTLTKVQRTINERWDHAKNFTEALEKRGLKITEK